MPYRLLHKHFSRRMLPLAALAGLVVAAVPPLSYRVVAWPQMEAQAAIYARQLAAGVQAAAAHQPYLWRYNAPKILQATAGHRAQRDIGAVTVTDCAGAVVFGPSEMAIGTGRGDGPRGEAPVTRGHATVARVAVALDQRAQVRTLRGLAAVSAIVGLLVGALLFWFPTRVVRRQARELDATVRRLEEAEAHLRGANEDLDRRVRAAVREVRALSGRVVGIQEEERLRIARDLHDGVGQAVTALQIALRLAAAGGDGAPARLAEAVRLAEGILAEIRATVTALRPAQIDAGLEDAARVAVERFELATGVPSSLRVACALPPVPDAAATCLLRILQEALANVGRHAAAGEVGVVLAAAGGAITLEVGDDGRGFDPAAPAAGAGLPGMRERAAFLGGRVDVESAPGAGTRVRVVIPIAEGGA